MISGDRPTIFASTLTYELGRQLGIEAAAREFNRQLQFTDRTSLPVARVFKRLSQIADVTVYHGASTTLPKARSRAAFEAFRSKADFWLMCDDDVECDSATLMRMLKVAGASSGAAVVLPCLMRGAGAEQSTVNVQFLGELVVDVAGVPTRRARRAGTGLMLVTRSALHEVSTKGGGTEWFQDDDGENKPALFAQLIDDEHRWLGEDFSFCDRLRKVSAPIYAVLQGVSQHAGQALQLESIR